jgi:hypothetical protein
MPRDNKLVDNEGRLLPQWRPVLEAAARLSRLSDEKLTALLGILDDSEGFLGAGGSGALGDILYKGSDGWLHLPIGVDGSVLQAQNGIPAYTETAAGRVLIREYNAAALTEVIIGPFDGAEYHKYEIDFDWITADGTGGSFFASASALSDASVLSNIYGAGVIAAPGIFGYAMSANTLLMGHATASLIHNGKMSIENYDTALGFGSFNFKVLSSDPATSAALVYNGAFFVPGVLKPYVKLYRSAGAFLSGTFRLYGIP